MLKLNSREAQELQYIIDTVMDNIHDGDISWDKSPAQLVIDLIECYDSESDEEYVNIIEVYKNSTKEDFTYMVVCIGSVKTYTHYQI